ncbi:sigma 54-interacting transcriptional regulator [Uliginosibacterium sp. sgz301328]|uniref:sigma 54-interacting transcriptional regulator n=1 Tax=Uliginosibacterium sp. sgz301328 TaxID=3243764 RepID=UPI00359DA580
MNIVLAGTAQLAEGVYFLADSGQLECWTDVSSLPAGNLLRTRHAASPYQCDGSVLRADFPSSVALAPYRRLGHYVTCPLQADICLGGIEYILGEAGIGDVDVTFLSQVAGLVANALVRIEQRQADFECEEQAQQERRSLQVLVDITNSVLSTLDVQDMVRNVAEAMRSSFGIDYVGLDLPDMDGAVFHSYEVRFGPRSDMRVECRDIAPVDSLGWRALQSGKAWVGDERTLRQLLANNPCVARLLNEGFVMACALPLLSGHKVIGVLNLAFSRMSALLRDEMPLLQQVGARIALGLGNALAYQEISRLRDRLASENFLLEQDIRNYQGSDEIIATSPAMACVLEQVEMVADSDCSVLILGETGTGKELIARAIHRLSRRREQRMVTVSCAAIPAGLLESDLFGHEKGAFTGAAARHIGRFETASQGTLFLDEVGDLPLDLQPKLLRVLQEREIERVGGSAVIPVDVRVIAATCRDLHNMVNAGEYRNDLYYRLNVFPITVPPLRERPDDIPLLANFFMRRSARRMNRAIDQIKTTAIDRLMEHSWPGNVRELENVIERAVILTRGSTLDVSLTTVRHEDMPKRGAFDNRPLIPVRSAPLRDGEAAQSERERIISALRETRGIVAGPRGAAVLLGLKRTTLLSRMHRFGISVNAALALDEAR